MEQAVIAFVLDLAQKYPQLAVIFIVMGVLRTIFKPLVAFARAFVQATPSQSDDLFLNVLEDSKVYKAIAFVVDYAASIKLPYYDVKK